MQALQGAALVGRDVIVPGNELSIQDGFGQGGFELTSPADQVKVEVLSPAGQVVDTLNLGTCQLAPIAPNGPPALPVVVEFFLRANADAAGVPFADELSLMVVHGVLHLLGYDHFDDEEAATMEAREMELLARVGRTRP